MEKRTISMGKSQFSIAFCLFKTQYIPPSLETAALICKFQRRILEPLQLRRKTYCGAEATRKSPRGTAIVYC